jgi:hypothetical protein
MNSLSSYNVYLVGLANSATALTDSSLYVMLYTVNLPLVISPGLYKINFNLADTTFAYTRLGNIQSQVTGGKLYMSCNISDLTADPSFGSWPPPNNSLYSTALSMRMDISLSTLTPAFTLGDYSAFAQLVFEHYSYVIGAYLLPVISDVSLTQNVGNALLQFTYTDANQDFPLYAKVILDGTADFDPIWSPSDFTAPVAMTCALPLQGWSTAQIRVSDNNINIVTYDFTNTANQDEVVPSAVACRIYPNPFNPAKGLLHIDFQDNKILDPRVWIYSPKGQLIRALNVSETSQWDGKSSSGNLVGDGVYLLRHDTLRGFIVSKILVIR